MSHSRFFYRFIFLSGAVGILCGGCFALDKAPEILAPVSEPVAMTGSETAVESGLEPVVESVEANKNSAADSAVKTAAEKAADSLAAYREGVNLASSAYNLSRSAVSPDDWNLIASRWERAADELKRVAKGTEHYEQAQQKRLEYTRHANQAAEQIRALERAAVTPIAPVRPPQPSPVATTTPVSAQNSGNSPTLSSADRANSEGKAFIPIVQRLHGTPVVRVTFNNSKSYEMIFDTGASRTLITRQMASDLAIVPTEQMVAATASENSVTFDVGTVEAISVGGATLENVSVSIGESVQIGLLGNDFLAGYDVTIRENVIELVAAR
jgi:predicted aspartyl protease